LDGGLALEKHLESLSGKFSKRSGLTVYPSVGCVGDSLPKGDSGDGGEGRAGLGRIKKKTNDASLEAVLQGLRRSESGGESDGGQRKTGTADFKLAYARKQRFCYGGRTAGMAS